MPLLTEVQQLVERDGLYAAGLIGYEAAPAFDSALRTRSATAFPFACFGIFGPPAILTALPAAGQPSGNPTWHPSVSREEYGAAIARIKNHIAAGDTYQVNYTLRQWSAFREDPWEFFLKTCADARYGAFVDAGPFSICSASPELFFSLQSERIFSKPMKGTAGRGRTSAEDRENGRWLYHSEKNRAENVMIVDMIRHIPPNPAAYAFFCLGMERWSTKLRRWSRPPAVLFGCGSRKRPSRPVIPFSFTKRPGGSFTKRPGPPARTPMTFYCTTKRER
jgi:para-aminobenzoate synthetase/4-amino-4-deoxychorismate lyase